MRLIFKYLSQINIQPIINIMKAFKFGFTLVISIFVLTFCADKPEETTMEPQNEEPEHLTLETLSQEYMGYPLMIEEAMLKVVRTQDELDELWQLPSSRVEKPETPAIDFNKYMLVVTAMGEQPTSGYSIEVTDTELKGDEWVLSVKETVPGPTCMNLMVITTPHHMALIPRTEKEINFEVTRVTVECEESAGY